jgi:gliding motility-associated-like protein
MRRFYFIAFLIFSLNSTMAQCPSIVMAMVNSCGTSEGINEFILFTTATNAPASNYTLYYGLTNPPSQNSLSGADASPITGTGTIISNGSCPVVNVVSPTTVIPAGSQVIIIPASFDQNYDITGLCNGNMPIYVIYVRTNYIVGNSSYWNPGGNMANNDPNPRYLQLVVNGNSGCNSTSAPVNNYTGGGNWPTSSIDGNFVYWTNNQPNYENNGCSILGLQTTGDTTVVACSSFSWYGNLYTSSTNLPTYTTTNALGFDSVVTLNLTINQPTSSDTFATACNSFEWHNQTFTSSNNTATFTTTNAVNCDSVVRLNLTINNSDFNAQTIPTCGPYVWNGINYENSGDYIYQYSNAFGCASADTLHLTIAQKPELGTDIADTICFGASVNLETYFPTTNFSDNWTFQQTPINSIQHVTASGMYQLIRLVTSGCADTANINLVVLPKVLANAGPDGIAAINYPYQLIGSGAGQYSWEPSSVLNDPNIVNPIATIQTNTSFVLTVTNDAGCSETDFVNIKAMEGPQVYVPTAFTPNGDRLNEKIKPICVGISRFDYFRIFDRFGKLIFETNNIGEGWDGYYKGKRQSSGNYISTVKVKDVTGKEYIKTSNLLLMY